MTSVSRDDWLASEWLEADGLAGFASGTVSGIRTRRYHALLLTATTPPTGRMVLVNGLEVWLEKPAGRFIPTVLRASSTFASIHGRPGPSAPRTGRRSARRWSPVTSAAT